MWHLTACKISVSLSFLNWVKNEMIFYRISELMLATLIQRYNKKSFHFKNERLTEILQAVRCHILDNKISILRNMKPLNHSWSEFYHNSLWPRWLSWMRSPTGDQKVAGSTPAEVGNILSWRLIMKYFLRSFSPFCWFKKASCQFLAKECAQYWLTA